MARNGGQSSAGSASGQVESTYKLCDIHLMIFQDEEPPEIDELEDKIKQLRFRVQTLTKVTQIKKQ